MSNIIGNRVVSQISDHREELSLIWEVTVGVIFDCEGNEVELDIDFITRNIEDIDGNLLFQNKKRDLLIKDCENRGLVLGNFIKYTSVKDFETKDFESLSSVERDLLLNKFHDQTLNQIDNSTNKVISLFN